MRNPYGSAQSRQEELNIVDQFIFSGSNISSTESDANLSFGKEWTGIDRLSTIRKFDSTNTLGKGMNPVILPPAMGK